MSVFNIYTEKPSFFNDWEGYISIQCVDNPMQSLRIVERNCTLSNAQAMRVYGYVKSNKRSVMPLVSRRGGPHKQKTDDAFLDLMVHDTMLGKNVHIKLADLPEYSNPELARALYGTGDEALRLKANQGDKKTLSGEEIQKIMAGERPR